VGTPGLHTRAALKWAALPSGISSRRLGLKWALIYLRTSPPRPRGFFCQFPAFQHPVAPTHAQACLIELIALMSDKIRRLAFGGSSGGSTVHSERRVSERVAAWVSGGVRRCLPQAPSPAPPAAATLRIRCTHRLARRGVCRYWARSSWAYSCDTACSRILRRPMKPGFGCCSVRALCQSPSASSQFASGGSTVRHDRTV
jgi:hypothetical protein